MPFEGFDPVESELGCRVQLMSADQLISYVKMYMRAMHGIKMAIEGNPERQVLQKLSKTYGPDAGLIVKWVLWNYDGIQDGKPISFFIFSSKMKWWTDKMYAEMQLHRRELEEKSTPYEKPGTSFTSMEDL
jgi:hypothetical protein